MVYHAVGNARVHAEEQGSKDTEEKKFLPCPRAPLLVQATRSAQSPDDLSFAFLDVETTGLSPRYGIG